MKRLPTTPRSTRLLGELGARLSGCNGLEVTPGLLEHMDSICAKFARGHPGFPVLVSVALPNGKVEFLPKDYTSSEALAVAAQGVMNILKGKFDLVDSIWFPSTAYGTCQKGKGFIKQVVQPVKVSFFDLNTETKTAVVQQINRRYPGRSIRA